MTYNEYINELKNSALEIPRVGRLLLERHHILPVCMGGTDDNDNLIWLKPEEHYIAHKLLAAEHMDNEKLLYTWFKMVGGGCDTPEKYAERVKRRNERVRDPEAIAKRKESRKNSHVRQGRPPRPIAQYTVTGEFVAEYSSAKEAAEVLNCASITLQNCALGFSKTAKGYIWKYITKDKSAV